MKDQKFVIPKVSVRLLSYSIIIIGALYFASWNLKAQNTNPEPSNTQNITLPQPNNNLDSNKKEETVAPPKKSPGLIDLFVVGGWSMWPLLLSSIIGFGVAIERLYVFYTSKLASKGYNQALTDTIEEKGLAGLNVFLEERKSEKISYILKNGMEVSSDDPEIFVKGVEREAGEIITVLERGLTVLASVSTIAPLIGFLGTVSGMISAFDAIANADQVNAKVVAGGIKEALVTTAAGLIVAIPAMAFYQFLTGKINGFLAEVEEAANQIYKEYLKQKAKLGVSAK